MLTLFDISGSDGIVMLAVIVYGAEGSDKFRVAILDPATESKWSGKINVFVPPLAITPLPEGWADPSIV